MNEPRESGSARRWPSGLWWAGPTAAALLGASVVSVALVPGSSESAAVPRQVVVADRATGSPGPSHRGENRGHGRPTRPHGTGSPSDGEHDDEPTVVQPSRAVESESPHDDERQRTATPTPTPSESEDGRDSPDPAPTPDNGTSDDHGGDGR